jgi:hypothetical protein
MQHDHNHAHHHGHGNPGALDIALNLTLASDESV